MTEGTIFKGVKIFNVFSKLKNKPKPKLGVDVS